MKNYLKTGILLFGISLLLWNCEKDTTTVIENQSIETDNSLSQDDISIESFDFEKFKEFPLYSQLDNFVKFNAKSRISKKKEHKFKIHKNTFKKITKKDIDYTSYTFLISDTENFEYTTVQNLVINQYKKNIEVFIFTYNSFDISDEHKYNINENVVIEQLFDFDISELGDLASRDGILIDGLGGDGTGDGEPSSGGGSSTYCYNVSIIIDYPCYGSGSLGTNHANCQCGTSVAPNCTQPHQEYYSEIFCTTEFNSSTTAGSYYISNNYSPTGGGGTPNVTTTDNDIIISSIIKNEIPEGADPLAFRLSLDSSSNAYNWLINPINVNEYNQIGLFLERNELSLEAKNFAKSAIIDILSSPIINSSNVIDYKTDILRMTKHLKEFGNSEDKLFANFVESLVQDFNSMTLGEVKDIYNLTRTQVHNLTRKYFFAVVTPIAKASQPFIEYALLDTGVGLGLKILQKLPLVVKTVEIQKIISRLTSSATSLSKFTQAEKFGIQTYAELVKVFENLGIARVLEKVQFHHLIEQRFVTQIGGSTNNWKSIVLTKAEHQAFTDAWRSQIGYTTDNVILTTTNATKQQVLDAARKVYKDYPEILTALGL